MWRFFIWFLLPAPKVGEQWTFCDKMNDPWNETHLMVVERRGNWYRLRNGSFYQSAHRADLVGFYRKTRRDSSN